MPNITFQIVVDLDAATVALVGRLVAAVEALAAGSGAASAPAAPEDAPAVAGAPPAPPHPPPRHGGARFGNARREPPPAAEIDDAPLPSPLPASHGQPPPPAVLRSRDGFASMAQREDAAAAAEAETAPAAYETVAAWGDANGVPAAGVTDDRLTRLGRVNKRRRALGLPGFAIQARDLGGPA